MTGWVTNCPKLRDVICGRPLSRSSKLLSFFKRVSLFQHLFTSKNRPEITNHMFRLRMSREAFVECLHVRKRNVNYFNFARHSKRAECSRCFQRGRKNPLFERYRKSRKVSCSQHLADFNECRKKLSGKEEIHFQRRTDAGRGQMPLRQHMGHC